MGCLLAVGQLPFCQALSQQAPEVAVPAQPRPAGLPARSCGAREAAAAWRLQQRVAELHQEGETEPARVAWRTQQLPTSRGGVCVRGVRLVCVQEWALRTWGVWWVEGYARGA